VSGSGAHTMVDATARERIVADLDTTFVVEAAAGTGKTTQLVRRIVAVLRGGRGRLEQIVALTFTDKAAGELKLRLRSEIDRVRGELALGSAERARLDAALAELEVARIGTIHSFCADLLRERPIEAGVDPAFEVMNDDERERVLGIAFDRWFERALADPPEGLRRFLRRRTWMRAAGPRTDLRRACRDLIEHRDHLGTWPRAAFDRPARIDALVEALAALASLHGRARRPSDYLAQCVADVAMFVDEIRRREASRPRDYDELEASPRRLASSSS